MASTFGSLEMSLRKFDDTNFNFWKEQMQDYLILRGQINPIETQVDLEELDEVWSGSSCNHSDASVQILILYGAIMSNNLWVRENVVKYIREKGGRNKDISYSAPLLPFDESV